MKSFGGVRFERGGVLVMTLVFVVMFLVIFMGLSGLVTRSYHEAVLQSNDELAFQIAENGLNYARWRLAHDPDNFANETKTVTDQFAGDLGSYTLTMTPPVVGSTIVMIESTGQTTGQAARQVTLRARYGRPSLAKYSLIVNSDVWYGGPTSGPMHVNGGIRMDGSSDSQVTSAKATYFCQWYHGCTWPFETKPGVWGDGTIQSLWEFPVAPIDYNALTLDLLKMKTAAINLGTYYGDLGALGLGYQIVFNDDNTYTISRVDSLGPVVKSKELFKPWKYLSHDVGSATVIETRNVPSNGVIYTEDRMWVYGDIRDRVTVAAGVFPDSSATNADIILNGNISYGGVRDGSRAFAAVAQLNILIPWSGAPDDMVLEGAFIAQKGSFFRRKYSSNAGAQAHRLKNSLTRYGMFASNGVPYTANLDWNNNVISGFQSGQASYDPNFLYAPPPYFPVSGQYEFISWEEVQ